MTEKDLIQKLTLLKQIQPDKDWVVSAKRQFILKEQKTNLAEQVLEVFRARNFSFKPVFISLVVLAFVGTGAVGLAQTALPGDLFYPIKKLTEKASQFLVAKDDLPKANLELANKRLDELTQVVKNNQTRNLAPALNEYEQSVAQAAKDLQGSPKVTKEIVEETEKLKQGQARVEALGVNVPKPEQLNEILSRQSQQIEEQIEYLEGRSLTENQVKLLAEAKHDYEIGDLNRAVEILFYELPAEVLNR